MSTNAPPFDPLHPTPEQERDMMAGYLAAKNGTKPPDASMAYEHGWRMRRNDIAGVVDDDQKVLAHLLHQENVIRAAEIRRAAEDRRQRLRRALGRA